MATWVLTCENCQKQFHHSEIADTLESLFIAPKPHFPPGGSQLECPNCHHKAVYQRVELMYRSNHSEPNQPRVWGKQAS
jgi:hypothetical protein